MEKVTMSVNEMNEILKYLATKPYAEVAQIINFIASKMPKEEKKEEKKTK